jgi:hypothetical protein
LGLCLFNTQRTATQDQRDIQATRAVAAKNYLAEEKVGRSVDARYQARMMDVFDEKDVLRGSTGKKASAAEGTYTEAYSNDAGG